MGTTPEIEINSGRARLDVDIKLIDAAYGGDAFSRTDVRSDMVNACASRKENERCPQR